MRNGLFLGEDGLGRGHSLNEGCAQRYQLSRLRQLMVLECAFPATMHSVSDKHMHETCYRCNHCRSQPDRNFPHVRSSADRHQHHSSPGQQHHPLTSHATPLRERMTVRLGPPSTIKSNKRQDNIPGFRDLYAGLANPKPRTGMSQRSAGFTIFALAIMPNRCGSIVLDRGPLSGLVSRLRCNLC